NIMQADENRPEHLLGEEQMPKIAPAERAATRCLVMVGGGVAGGAIAAGLDGSGVLGELGVAEADLPRRGEGRGVAAIAGGEGATEHLYPGQNSGNDVSLVADTHEVAGLCLGHQRCGVADDALDLIGRLPHRNPADGVPREVDRADAFDGPGTLVEIGPALDDA